MNTNSSCLFNSRALRTTLLVIVLPMASGPAFAENPFRVIGAKAKQGLTKVKQAVHPRRIGTALKNVKNAAVEASERTRAEFTSGSDSTHATIPPYGDPYYYEVPTSRRWELSRMPPQPLPSTSSPSAPASRENPIRPDYYTASRYQTLPPRTSYPDISAAAAALRHGSAHVPVPPAEGNPDRIQVDGTITPPSAREGGPDHQAPASAPALSPTTPSGSAPVAGDSRSASTTKPAPSAPAREDLPFGELVPGKAGFVYSPWSNKALVDVSGIPTGTRVKCPYTSKTFRVP
jgi:hypothetical protein